jgi:molybdate transport system regulatory protein
MKDPAIRFRIDFAENNNLGPGKIALLEAVQATGSISDAARALKMSYRRAWLLVSSLNTAFDEPVTVAVTGGKGGGGARVTAFGSSLIAAYRELETEITQLGVQRLAAILPHVANPLNANRRPARKPLARRVSGALRRS